MDPGVSGTLALSTALPFFGIYQIFEIFLTKGEIDEEYDEIAPQPGDLPVVPDQIEVRDP